MEITTQKQPVSLPSFLYKFKIKFTFHVYFLLLQHLKQVSLQKSKKVIRTSLLPEMSVHKNYVKSKFNGYKMMKLLYNTQSFLADARFQQFRCFVMGKWEER